MTNKVEIFYDDNSEMFRLSINNEYHLEGNYRDFLFPDDVVTLLKMLKVECDCKISVYDCDEGTFS